MTAAPTISSAGTVSADTFGRGRIEITGPLGDRYQQILTPAALAFVAELDRRFAGPRVQLLAARRQRAEDLARGANLDFSAATAAVRSDPDWQVAPPARGLVDRRVEITGPPEPKMAINALNSGAQVWMADLEDATSPTWSNVITGQLTLLDAVHDRLTHTASNGKHYAVGADPATIVVRPRGWHLVEKHIRIDGRRFPASLVDFGLYLFHCAQAQLDRGSGPYFYLPKLESHLEARLWNDIFLAGQDLLGMARGTIRATVLIETVYAAFEMEEILYELREHSSGLNAGRWDPAHADRQDGLSRLAQAREVFEACAMQAVLPPFMTSWAYCRYLVTHR